MAHSFVRSGLPGHASTCIELNADTEAYTIHYDRAGARPGSEIKPFVGRPKENPLTGNFRITPPAAVRSDLTLIIGSHRMSEERGDKAGNIRRIARYLRSQAAESAFDNYARRMVEVAGQLDQRAHSIEIDTTIPS
jgi:hypothetical protein